MSISETLFNTSRLNIFSIKNFLKGFKIDYGTFPVFGGSRQRSNGINEHFCLPPPFVYAGISLPRQNAKDELCGTINDGQYTLALSGFE